MIVLPQDCEPNPTMLGTQHLPPQLEGVFVASNKMQGKRPVRQVEDYVSLGV